MTEEKQNKKVELTEQQLMQMAQQEEAELMNKQARFERIASVYKETILAKDALKEIQKNSQKAIINLGATVLIEVEVKDTKKCKRGISENAYKEETIEETIKWLEEREGILQKQMGKISSEAKQSEERLTNFVGILKQIDAEKRNLREQVKKSPPTISK